MPGGGHPVHRRYSTTLPSTPSATTAAREGGRAGRGGGGSAVERTPPRPPRPRRHPSAAAAAAAAAPASSGCGGWCVASTPRRLSHLRRHPATPAATTTGSEGRDPSRRWWTNSGRWWRHRRAGPDQFAPVPSRRATHHHVTSGWRAARGGQALPPAAEPSWALAPCARPCARTCGCPSGSGSSVTMVVCQCGPQQPPLPALPGREG